MGGFNFPTIGRIQTKAKLSDQQISKLKHTYLSQIEGMVKAHNILVINWDQARVKVVTSHNWIMEQQEACQVEIEATNGSPLAQIQ